MQHELEYFRLAPKNERPAWLGSALIGIVDGAGDSDKILAECARKYVAAFRIVEGETA